MSGKAEEREKHQEPKQNTPPPSDEKKRKPRGALFHSGDSTLAERLEDEVYNSRR